MLPPPLWCIAANTERGCRPEDCDVALCGDRHSQHQEYTLPPCVQTNCELKHILDQTQSTASQLPYFSTISAEDTNIDLCMDKSCIGVRHPDLTLYNTLMKVT